MKRLAPAMVVATGAALVLLATLPSSEADATMELGSYCILCGDRGLADAILNVILFLPLGAGLALVKGPALAILGSFTASGAVELAQFHIPGRFPTLGDILFNTSGGTIGALVAINARRLRGWVFSASAATRTASLLIPIAAFLATGALSFPRYPDRPYYGQWTHRLGNLLPYPGRVLSASVGGLPLRDGRIRDMSRVRTALQQGGDLHVQVRAGPSPARPSHLFALYDDRRREVLQITVQGPDLLLHRRTVAAALLLDQPSLDWRDALGVLPGDTTQILLRQGPSNLCVQVGDKARCDLSPGVEAGWRFLARLDGSPPGMLWLLSWAWLFLLAAPVGLTAPGDRQAILEGAALGVLGAGVSWLSPGLSLHPFFLSALVLGPWCGHVIRRRIQGSV